MNLRKFYTEVGMILTWLKSIGMIDVFQWISSTGSGTDTGSCTPTYEDYLAFLPNCISPSRHALSELMDFERRKQAMYDHMRSTTILPECSWLSCDHTFACTGMTN